MMTLEQLIAELEQKETKSAAQSEGTADDSSLPDSVVKQLEYLSDQAIALKKAYQDIKKKHDEAMINLLLYMREHKIKSSEHAGYKITASDGIEVNYSDDLHIALKGLLSEAQWKECFEPQPPKIKKRGINKFLKMGGQVASIIMDHQVVKQATPRPSDLRIEKITKEGA